MHVSLVAHLAVSFRGLIKGFQAFNEGGTGNAHAGWLRHRIPLVFIFGTTERANNIKATYSNPTI